MSFAGRKPLRPSWPAPLGATSQGRSVPVRLLSFPGPLLSCPIFLPRISPYATQVRVRVSTREGTRPCGCKRAGKGGVRFFGMESPWVGPAVCSHHTLLPQAGAEQVCDVFMPLLPPTSWTEITHCLSWAPKIQELFRFLVRALYCF